ncbi:hypothetical protein VB796_01180 [Arcicella sp. LKC2W]|uniref:asparagine synthetase B n=1 Tax=Arcicella sp. LKC2W TaxID=2984198 RepID=UPI002B21A12E|nr:asparagine synthetase B [Arcicella sp. LKC2W]MEA5457628.1 hypothetical protein [Arcicella sp. LKC2W]
MKKWFWLLIFLFGFGKIYANSIFIPMDERQANHLKAYGIAYWILKADQEVKWLVNYQGGSFLMNFTAELETECRVRGVTYEVISSADEVALLKYIADPNLNMDAINLVKSAKIAVYSPIKISKASFEDTDAVLLVLKYAEIPFDVVYDEEIMRGDLVKYDWLHLHHEDFTGQYGKNLWRISPEDIKAQENIAKKFGFKKNSDLKLEVAKAIKAFCAGGGYLFAMCSGAETIDVALAAEGIDIVSSEFDGNGIDKEAQQNLDFSKTLAFGDFLLELGNDSGERRMRSFSNINSSVGGKGFGGWSEDENETYFNLFNFSAKWDIIPALLTQNHEFQIREFMGQTTAFNKKTVKPNVLVMGSSKSSDRYIYGEVGRGQFAFYGGHDPEGRKGFHRTPTDLNIHPHSPGYRLILNNVLFPSARKKKRKT